MKKFKKFLLAGLCGLVLTSAIGLTACNNGETQINVIGGDYSYTNPIREKAEGDEGFVVDGILNEPEYATVKSLDLKKRYGYETADVHTTVYFGEKGIYFGFVDTENNRIYANEERSTVNGSGIELYLMIGGMGVDEGSINHAFEIDLTAGGRLSLKRYGCFTQQSTWRQCARPAAINPYMAVTAQGGEVNTPECTGYTVEFYMPYTYFVDLGLMNEAVKPSYVYVSPCHIKSNSAVASDGTRTWWALGQTQLSTFSYGNPRSWYKVDANGFVTNDINVTYTGTGSGIVTEKNGFDNMPNNNSLTLNIVENPGSSIKSFKVNGVECVKQIVSDGSKGIYTLAKVTGAINIEAEFEEEATVTHSLTGKIINNSSTDWDTVIYDIALYANRSIKDIDVDIDTETGDFYADLAEGEYKLILRSTTGETIFSQDLVLNDDVEMDVYITDDNYGPNRTVQLGSEKTAGATTTLFSGMVDNTDFVMKFYFGSEFGAEGAATITKYVGQLNIISESGTQILQLLRWDSAYLIKLDQSGGSYAFDATVKATYIAQQGLYIILVREGDILSLYVDDGAGNLVQLAGGYHTLLSDNIVNITMQGFDGVSGYAMIYFDDAEVKLGTTDYRYFNDKVDPLIKANEDQVDIEGLKDDYYSLGENINLTILPKDGYMIYGIYYNGKSIEIKEDGEYSFTCGVGAIIQVNSVAIGPIAIDCNDMVNGTITFEKSIETYELGDDVEFYLEGDEGYRVAKLFINDEDVTGTYTKMEKVDGLFRFYYKLPRCVVNTLKIFATFEEEKVVEYLPDATISSSGGNNGVTYDINLLDKNTTWVGFLGFDETMDLSVKARWHISVRIYTEADNSLEVQLLRWDTSVMFKLLPNGSQSGSIAAQFAGNANIYNALLRDQGLKTLIEYDGSVVNVYACDVNGAAVKLINGFDVGYFNGLPIAKINFYKAETNFSGKDAYITDSKVFATTGLDIKVVANETENGSVYYTDRAYKLGESVTFTVMPDNGYIVDTFTVNGVAVELDENYQYKLPCIDSAKINVEATFKETPKANVILVPDVMINDGMEFTFVNTLTDEITVAELLDGEVRIDGIDYGFYNVYFTVSGVDVMATIKIEGDGEQEFALSTIGKVPANLKDEYISLGLFYVEALDATKDFSYNTAISGNVWMGAELKLDAEDYATATTELLNNFVRFGINFTFGTVDAGIVASIEGRAFNLLSLKTGEKVSLNNADYITALTDGDLYLIINRKANGTAVAYIANNTTVVEIASFNVGTADITSVGACFWYGSENYAFSYNAQVKSFMVGKTLAEVLGGAVIVPTADTQGKGEVNFDKDQYDIGDTVNIEVTCTAEKTSIVGVAINEVDYTDLFTKGETWTLTLPNSMLTALNVVVTYVEQSSVDATITVSNTYGNMNGVIFSFYDKATGDKVAQKTVVDGAMTISDIETGTVLKAYINNLSGITNIYVGEYTVSGEEPKELPLDGIFANTAFTTNDYADYNVTTGYYAMESGEDTSVPANFAIKSDLEGDVYISVKFTSATANELYWLDDPAFAIQMGIYMTVEGSANDIGSSLYFRMNGNEEFRVIQNNTKTAIFADDGMDYSDFLEGGLYLLIKRDGATGEITTWIGQAKDAMIECGTVAGSTGAITALGVAFYSATEEGLNATATDFEVSGAAVFLGYTL